MRQSGNPWHIRALWASTIAIAIALAAVSLASELGSATPGFRADELEDSRIREALVELERAPSGHELLLRARKRLQLSGDQRLSKVFRWGSVSRTDAVLTRHFDPSTGEERQEREIAIYLKKGQGLPELLLDVAHELAHAGSNEVWDPYDPDLDASAYVWNAIEGDGGEVDALVTECRVGREIAAASALARSRCAQYGETLDRGLVRQEFYRVGKWHPELEKKLDATRFPLLSTLDPKLYSSTGRAPYPAALLQEYEEMTEIACENSRRRATASPNRALASSGDLAPGAHARTDAFLRKRCSERR